MGIFSWSFGLQGSSDFDRGSIQDPGSGSAPDRLSLACGFLPLPVPLCHQREFGASAGLVSDADAAEA